MATRERSPNYPAHGLGESIEMVRRLYAAEKRGSVPPESAATALGYTSLSGRARVKISTLRKFGLIDEAKGRLRVSDLAMRILFASNPQEEYFAKNEAAQRPELFRELRENGEASDATLINDLIRKGFSVEGAKAAVASFRETMAVVSSSPEPTTDAPEEGEAVIEQPSAFQAGSPPTGLRRQTETPIYAGQNVIAMTPPGGQRVEIRIQGGPWTKAAAELLRKHLDLVEALIKGEIVDEATTASPSAPPLPDERSRSSSPD